MKPLRCNNCKLFYDADEFSNCPHCQADIPAAQPAMNEPVFSQQQMAQQAPQMMPQQPPVKPAKESKFSFGKKKKTTQANNMPAPDMMNIPPMAEPQNGAFAADIPAAPTVSDEQTQFVTQNFPQPEEKIQETDNLRKAIQSSDSMQKTVAFYALPNENEPVVGWIVCVKGEYIGESFNLKSGKNHIGRSLTMDVALAKERSVSREKHATILYEPNKMQFFLQPGDSSGLTYLNDDLLMAFGELKAGDKITLGDSSFVFVPLCGEKFNWDEYIKN